MSSNFEGTWVVTQKWGQTPQYSFNMDVSANGRITIEGGFVGTIIQLGRHPLPANLVSPHPTSHGVNPSLLI